MLLRDYLKGQTDPRQRYQTSSGNQTKWDEICAQMAGAHYFDVTEVYEASQELARRWVEGYNKPDGRGRPFDGTLAFLPFSKIWLESERIDENGPCRLAYFIVQRDDERASLHTLSHFAAKRQIKLHEFNDEMLLRETAEAVFNHQPGDRPVYATSFGNRGPDGMPMYNIHFGIYALLAMINSPRIIEQLAHPPQRTLTRKLAAIDAAFEPTPWHTIQLKVTREAMATAGQGHDAVHGNVALHFVRSFVRVRFGQLEIVNAHMRGNPEKGFAGGDYRVRL
jgi:hypothetical protein